MNNAFIIIAILLLFKTLKGEAVIPEINLEDYNFSGESAKLTATEKKNYLFIKAFVYNLIAKYDGLKTPIPYDLIYAIVYQEASQQILKGVPNNLLVGYDGKSIGYFQVTKWAVAEYNQREKQNLTYADCYNEKENFYVGMCYIYYCYSLAEKNIFVTAKKYNGGLDETAKSKNDMANSYATKVEKRYNIYKSISKA